MKRKLLLLACLLFVSCSAGGTSSITSSSEDKATSESTSSSQSLSDSSSSDEQEYQTIAEIKSLGDKINEGQVGQSVSFKGLYAKEITDGSDKLMLFVDETGFIYVRVIGGFSGNNQFLKNRYKNCYYDVSGQISKTNGNIEIKYNELKNITETPETFDFTKVSEKKNSLKEVYEEIEKVTLNKKDTGVGKIVTFKATVIATDRSDANTKAVVYDNEKTLTIINDKKICDGTKDIGNTYIFTGSISILKSSPAIWLLSMESTEKETLSFTNAEDVIPSYFKKWYYVSDHIKKPTYEDYSKLYKITGYVTDNSDYTSKYNLGLVDTSDGSLSDNNISGYSVNGVFLMNNHNLDEFDLTKSVFYDYYINYQKITVYASLYQFNTSDHGWKVFPIDYTIQLA